MSTFDAWLQGTGPLISLPKITEGTRAALAYRRILDKPTSVTFRTPAGVTLAAQLLRLEMNDRSSLIISDSGAAPRMQLIIFGIRNHESLPNSDIAEGYRFIYASDEYRVEDVILQLGEIQGVAVATG